MITMNDTNDKSSIQLPSQGEGFIIECQNGETVVVSDNEAQRLLHVIDYFRNVFKHGTREAEERVLIKPDWSLATAQHIIRILTGKMVKIPMEDVSGMIELIEASTQILFLPHVYYPLFLRLQQVPMDRKLAQKFLGILNYKDKTAFSFRSRLCGLMWDILLRSGLLVLKEDPSQTGDQGFGDLMFGVVPSQQSEDMTKKIKVCMKPESIYLVLTPCNVSIAVGRLTKILHLAHRKMAEGRNRHRHNWSQSVTAPVETEEISVMIPVKYSAKGAIPTDSPGVKSEEELIDLFLSKISSPWETEPKKEVLAESVEEASRKFGTHGRMFTPRTSTRTFPTFHGSPEGLHKTLDFLCEKIQLLNQDEVKVEIPEGESISLRVTAPIDQTLKRMIGACAKYNENRDKVELEVDFYHHSYYIRRNLKEIMQLLEYMSRPVESDIAGEAEDDNVEFLLKEKDSRRRY